MTEKKREPKDWEKYYSEVSVEEMPWFHEAVDADLLSGLDRHGLTGGSALDLGTGPGIDAMALASMGFDVTATDISGSAVKKAQSLAAVKGLSVKFVRDDVRTSTLTGPFDIIFDRGCFHTMQPEERGAYIKTVEGLLRPGAYLFLKCFSHKETMEEGPYRFSPEDIREMFREGFTVLSIEESVFYGTLDKPPLALFCVMKRR